jgi:hypothetical protein
MSATRDRTGRVGERGPDYIFDGESHSADCHVPRSDICVSLIFLLHFFQTSVHVIS